MTSGCAASNRLTISLISSSLAPAPHQVALIWTGSASAGAASSAPVRSSPCRGRGRWRCGRRPRHAWSTCRQSDGYKHNCHYQKRNPFFIISLEYIIRRTPPLVIIYRNVFIDGIKNKPTQNKTIWRYFSRYVLHVADIHPGTARNREVYGL